MESRVHIFTAEFEWHHDCMHHCQKISGGRSPPVTTRDEWEYFKREIDLIVPPWNRSTSFPYLWLSATEGDKGDRKLARLDHWNDTEIVNNETLKLEALETIWRDFYTGQRLGNWTKPYYTSKKDTVNDNTYNCMMALTDTRWDYSWDEWQCVHDRKSCPCTYPTQPLLRLRGRDSFAECSFVDIFFSPKQLPGDPRSKVKSKMILLGQYDSKIEYND